MNFPTTWIVIFISIISILFIVYAIIYSLTKIGEVDMTELQELQEIEERLKNIEGRIMKNYYEELTILEKLKGDHNPLDEFNLENFKTSLCEKYNLHIDELGNVKFGINVVMSASGNVNFSAWHMGLFSHSIFMFDDEEAVVIDSNAMADEFEKGFGIMHGHIIEIYTKCGIKIEGENYDNKAEPKDRTYVERHEDGSLTLVGGSEPLQYIHGKIVM